jgi:hypothetical protein
MQYAAYIVLLLCYILLKFVCSAVTQHEDVLPPTGSGTWQAGMPHSFAVLCTLSRALLVLWEDNHYRLLKLGWCQVAALHLPQVSRSCLLACVAAASGHGGWGCAARGLVLCVHAAHADAAGSM